MAMRVVPKTQLRDRIREELSYLFHQDIVITHRGRPAAVIVHIDRWNHLQEQLELLEAALALHDFDRPDEADALAATYRHHSKGPRRRPSEPLFR